MSGDSMAANNIGDRKHNKYAALMVIASAVLWGLYGSFVTLLTSMGLSRNVLVFLRLFATALPVGILMLILDPSQFRVRRRDIPLFVCNGVFSLFFFTFCYTEAIKVTKIATAAALLYTAPAIVMVLSAVFFHEKMTPRKVFCCILTVIGCAFASGIASGGGGGSSAAGILMGLGAGLGYALYSIFSRAVLNRGYSVFTNVFYSFSTAMVCYFVLAWAEGTLPQIAEDPGRTFLGLLCGLLTGSMAYVLYTAGMERMETSKAAQLAAIEPVTSVILGSLLFRQPLSSMEFTGIIMVIASVILN